jgi:hypothetical protein
MSPVCSAVDHWKRMSMCRLQQQIAGERSACPTRNMAGTRFCGPSMGRFAAVCSCPRQAASMCPPIAVSCCQSLQRTGCNGNKFERYEVPVPERSPVRSLTRGNVKTAVPLISASEEEYLFLRRPRRRLIPAQNIASFASVCLNTTDWAIFLISQPS